MLRTALASRSLAYVSRGYCTASYRLVLPNGGWLDLETPTTPRPLALGESTFSADQLRRQTPVGLPPDQYRVGYRVAMEALQAHPELQTALATQVAELVRRHDPLPSPPVAEVEPPLWVLFTSMVGCMTVGFAVGGLFTGY